MDFRELIIKNSEVLLEAIRKLNETGKKILLVVDDNDKFIGTLTDGDIRRYILRTGGITGIVDDATCKNPFTVHPGYDRESVKKVMKENLIELVPVIDGDGRIIEVIFSEREYKHTETKPLFSVDTSAVIMAGGAGTRLKPFTNVLPKALIPYGDKSAIEHIIHSLCNYGIKEIWVSVYHKSRIMKLYLNELNLPCELKLVEEDTPLGTFGVLFLIKDKIKYENVLVTNCDTILDIDYFDLYAMHKKNKNDITVVVAIKSMKIPYGICEITDGGELKRIIEKPESPFLVVVGTYLIHKSALEIIEEKKPLDAITFINTAKKLKKKVGIYPVRETQWMDLGNWEEYLKSLKFLSEKE